MADFSHDPTKKNQWYEDWIKDNMHDQSGKVAIITGANSGTGFWCAHALAGAGATVILACRTMSKAEAAKKHIIDDYPKAKVDVIQLDTFKLTVVRAFADAFLKKYNRLDILCNNAGVMGIPYSTTEDGLEIQFQTNHIGHFLLTKLLWDVMLETPGQTRIIQHSSQAHRIGSAYFNKDHMEEPQHSFLGGIFWLLLSLSGYVRWPWLRYAVSKLCNVLFMRSLEEKINEQNLQDKMMSVAAHPGFAHTNLQAVAGEAGTMPNFESQMGDSQSAADGSLPILMGCVGDAVKNGDYLGPQNGWTGIVGPPGLSAVAGYGNDKKQRNDLWSFSEECIGEKWDI